MSPRMKKSPLKYKSDNMVVSLTTLNSVIKRLQNPKKIVNWIGILTHGKLLKNWPQGKGGNDRRMPILTTEYKDWKVKHGGEGKANLNFDLKAKGYNQIGATSLYKSMTVKDINKYNVAVGPADSGNNKKLRYILELRPNAMKVNRKFKAEMRKEAKNLIFQGL